jgi:hypothetical protein
VAASRRSILLEQTHLAQLHRGEGNAPDLRLNSRSFGLAFMSYCFYLYRVQLDEWILPVMDGFIHVEVCEVGGLIFDYILMSRRSCFRTGITLEISSIQPAHADNGPLTLIDCINRCPISDARRRPARQGRQFC